MKHKGKFTMMFRMACICGMMIGGIMEDYLITSLFSGIVLGSAVQQLISEYKPSDEALPVRHDKEMR